ncbi:predicted protein [Postia placenta Mad-698-R]|uniref:Uncharacterized protein n=1 Tax=Postia placenta MAD-698-R-SB12 TaxID=670580 RepID=A0A1X6N3S9_9APHY|nr:hypothetical protein POSPLADRAFT_1140426 [Postia placenta MAD-698-R-SB12]EED85892.1 predicted protein [Postia placenta Mad-698-R]OSX63180.1 hypothetical protein POSPLADRAFT_1140426 [Postia placenta MAD-698-R-SB12]
MTSWQQNDAQYRSMDNNTQPYQHLVPLGEVTVEREQDIAWIAEVCDDLAGSMSSEIMARISRMICFQVAYILRAQPYRFTEDVHHPMAREQLIAFEDGLEYDASILTLCADTSNVSTAPAPGLHMADQNTDNNEYDARADGEEDLLNEHDYEVPLMASSSSVLPSAAWRGEELDGATVLPTINGSAGEDYVDVGTRVWPSARPSQISDASAARGARATTSIEHSRSPLPLPGPSSTPTTTSTTILMEEEQESNSCPGKGIKRGRDDDSDEENNDMAHVEVTTSVEPTQERKVKKIRIEPTEVPHVTCPGCGGSFREDTFGRHWRDHCGMSPERENRQPLICDVCRRMWQPGNNRLRDFSTDHSLRRHVVRRHTEEDWHAMQRERGKKTRRSHKRSKGASR